MFEKVIAEIETAAKRGRVAVLELERKLGGVRPLKDSVAIALLFAFRRNRGWADMVRVFEEMAPEAAGSPAVQEQLGFALNRTGDFRRAEQVLVQLIATLEARREEPSEALGILGRVYKDRWEEAETNGDRHKAEEYLAKAIETYERGFQANPKNAYPGINALTLRFVQTRPADNWFILWRRVSDAVSEKIQRKGPDYFDHATRLELAVLAEEEINARDALRAALNLEPEPWAPETTSRNLRLIRETYFARFGVQVGWVHAIEAALRAAAGDAAPEPALVGVR